MILLEKNVKPRPESTISFTDNNTRVFKLESSTYILNLYYLGLATEIFPPEILASLNSGKSISILALGINRVILAEVHVFLNPGTKTQCCLCVPPAVQFYSSSGCPCESDGSHILGGGQQLGLKVMLCQGLLRPDCLYSLKFRESPVVMNKSILI